MIIEPEFTPIVGNGNLALKIATLKIMNHQEFLC